MRKMMMVTAISAAIAACLAFALMAPHAHKRPAMEPCFDPAGKWYVRVSE